MNRHHAHGHGGWTIVRQPPWTLEADRRWNSGRSLLARGNPSPFFPKLSPPAPPAANGALGTSTGRVADEAQTRAPRKALLHPPCRCEFVFVPRLALPWSIRSVAHRVASAPKCDSHRSEDRRVGPQRGPGPQKADLSNDARQRANATCRGSSADTVDTSLRPTLATAGAVLTPDRHHSDPTLRCSAFG